MSYNQHFSIDTVINNIEKNCTSISKYIQPEWLRSYYKTITEANFALTRTVMAEAEKVLTTKIS